MDLAYIDNLAVNGQGPLHRAGAWSKLFMLSVVLAGAIFSRGWVPLVAVTALLGVLILVERLPLVKLLPFLGYPLFFAALFALVSRGWSLFSLLIILKSLTAGLVLIIVLATTPYGELFQVLARFLPTLVIDGLVMTYRCFFLLLDRLANHLKGLKLRGGYSGISFWKNVPRVAAGLGLVFIHSWEMAERMYCIMALRGYEGKFGLLTGKAGICRYDLWPVIWGLIFGGVVIGT